MQRKTLHKQYKKLGISAVRRIGFSFFAVILIGSILLSLPMSHSVHSTSSYLDHLFVATSATCVTGLVTHVTASEYTLFGQIVIILLIQIGGLGFLTLMSMFFVLLKRKLTYDNKIVMQEALNRNSLNETGIYIKRVIKYTVCFELIGAICLAFVFIPQFGTIELFHAIENNVDFLIRAKDLNVQRFLGIRTLPDKLDTTIELILTRTQSKKKHKHPEKESQYHYICKNIAFDYLNPADISDEYLLKLRIVRVEVSDGVFENIITTLSEEDFTPDDIKYCYNLRWGIETSFRDLKHTIGATNLHSKKTEYVAFELWSKLILYNFCSIIILHVPVKSRNRKYEYQVNFSLAMKICFDFLRGVAPPNVESLISKYILPISNLFLLSSKQKSFNFFINNP